MIPEQAVHLVAEFEGFRSHAYKCPAGVWTIGYGTTWAPGLGDVKPNMSVSEPEARRLLVLRLQEFAEQIWPRLSRVPNDNQWAAMLSLAYNIGPGAFRRSSVLRYFNQGDDVRAANAFLLWNKATDPNTGRKVVVRGLVVRRYCERSTFLARRDDD